MSDSIAFINDVITRTLIFATPLFLATIGEILTERAGVLNLGMEGILAFGAFCGFAGTYASGSILVGMILALVGGAVLGLLHASFSVTFRVNQVVSGLAITMLGTGLADFCGRDLVGKSLVEKAPQVSVPGLRDLPFIGPFFEQTAFFYIAILAAAAIWFLFRHTIWGIRIRSVGENPKAADAQGVAVSRIKYLAVIAGAALAALGGAQLSMAYHNSWINNVAEGRGWVVIGLTIFALWNPIRSFWGSLLFGGFFVLQLPLQKLDISPYILGMLPYLATLGVLVLDGLRKDTRRLVAPAMLGETWRRSER